MSQALTSDTTIITVNSIEGVTRAANTLQQVVLVEAPDWQPASI